jgi:outer membrane protein assembly factor BamB
LYTMIRRMLLLFLLVPCPLGPVFADDWPQWRGPNRMGVSKETGLLQSWPPEGPKLLWTFPDAGSGDSGMAIVGDRLYSIGSQGKKEYVYAIDLKTQKKLWSVEVGPLHIDNGCGEGPRSTPAVDGDFVCAIGGHGDLVCVNTATGKKIWSQGLKTSLDGKKPMYGFSESPLIDGDQVVASPGSLKGPIMAFDKKTGTLKWRCLIPANFVKKNRPGNYGDSTYTSMIAIESGGVRQYVQILGSILVGVRASDGKVLWSYRISTLNSPIYHNDCVFVPSVGREASLLVKLIPEGGQFKTEKIYGNQEMQNEFTGIVQVGEYLYGFSSGRVSIAGEDGGSFGSKDKRGWMCLDFKTGKTVWVKDRVFRNRVSEGSIIFADGNLYCFHTNGCAMLIKATPAGYQEGGQFYPPGKRKRCWTYPALANGKLYLRDLDRIYCYDVRKPK